MKIAIATATYFADAIIDLLTDAGYDMHQSYGDSPYILVNTTKLTARDGITTGSRQVLCPTSQWAVIAALVQAIDGGAQAPAVSAGAAQLRPAAAVATAFGIPVSAAAVNPVDAAGNVLAIGDTVLVKLPDGKKPVFTLRTNGVAVITRITAKGALGFDFDLDNEFLSKRFQKVTLTPIDVLHDTDAYGSQVYSGDLVVARPGRHSRTYGNAAKFDLPENQALVFRGVTQDKGNFILDGYAEHQYAPARFSVVSPV